MSLTPESLRTQIAKLRDDASRYREQADELDLRAKGLQERLEVLERGELPPDELRTKIVALAQIDGWITVPRISRFYPAVPTHQIERACQELERDRVLERNGETDHNYERGRPAQKYMLNSGSYGRATSVEIRGGDADLMRSGRNVELRAGDADVRGGSMTIHGGDADGVRGGRVEVVSGGAGAKPRRRTRETGRAS